MNKSYYSLGLMSGTSGDGIDASIIKSDGQTQYEAFLDKYFEYNLQIQENIHTLKDKITNSSEKLIEFSKEISSLERSITLFHAEAANEVLKVMENSFLSEFKKRDYFNQCTNSDELEQLMNKKKNQSLYWI